MAHVSFACVLNIIATYVLKWWLFKTHHYVSQHLILRQRQLHFPLYKCQLCCRWQELHVICMQRLLHCSLPQVGHDEIQTLDYYLCRIFRYLYIRCLWVLLSIYFTGNVLLLRPTNVKDGIHFGLLTVFPCVLQQAIHTVPKYWSNRKTIKHRKVPFHTTIDFFWQSACS